MKSQHEVRQAFGGGASAAAIAAPPTHFSFGGSRETPPTRSTPTPLLDETAINISLRDVESAAPLLEVQQTSNYSLSRLQAVNDISEVSRTETDS